LDPLGLFIGFISMFLVLAVVLLIKEIFYDAHKEKHHTI
jgi:hypothetical protein